MQRIKTVTNPTGKAAELLDAVKASMGSTPNIFTAFANAPAVLEGFLNFSGALSAGKLNAGLRESLALTIAGFNGCNYCASAHTFIGDKTGLSADELAANLRGESSDVKTQAALKFALEVLETRGHASQEALNTVVEAGYTKEEAIEIVGHVALNTLTNYFNETFAVEVDFPPVSTSAISKVA